MPDEVSDAILASILAHEFSGHGKQDSKKEDGSEKSEEELEEEHRNIYDYQLQVHADVIAFLNKCEMITEDDNRTLDAFREVIEHHKGQIGKD